MQAKVFDALLGIVGQLEKLSYTERRAVLGAAEQLALLVGPEPKLRAKYDHPFTLNDARGTDEDE